MPAGVGQRSAGVPPRAERLAIERLAARRLSTLTPGFQEWSTRTGFDGAAACGGAGRSRTSAEVVMRTVGLAALLGSILAGCNQQGDACQQLFDAFQSLTNRLSNCQSKDQGSASQCEQQLPSCSAADVRQLEAFATCINGIQGGDCNSDPSLVDQVATAEDACANGLTLSAACSGGDGGVTELTTATSSQSIGGCPSPGPSTLDGLFAPGTACTDPHACAPVCCSCSDGQFLAAACQNETCAPVASVCSLAESQRNPGGTCQSQSTSGGSSGGGTGGGCLQNADCPVVSCACTNKSGTLPVQLCVGGICDSTCPATVTCS